MVSQKPDTEIEITPEMIEAGLSVLSDFDPDSDSGSGFVVRLYQVMFEKSLGGNPKVSTYGRMLPTS